MYALQLVAAVALAVLGYRQAKQFEQRSGERAWGLPAEAWAAIFGFSLLLGAAMFYFATRGSDHAPKSEWRLLRGVLAGMLALFGAGTLAMVYVDTSSGAGSGATVNLVASAVGVGFFGGAFLLVRSMRRRGRGGAGGVGGPVGPGSRFVL